MTVITELNEIINLLESELPANPRSPVNQKHTKALERELRKYFKSLEQAFPYDRIDNLYYKYAIKESIGQESEYILDPILTTLRASLLYRLNGYLAAIYISGTAQMTEWAGLPYEGAPMLQAIDYASKHCAKLVTQMDDETKTRLAKVISDGIRDKRGVPGLARDIKKEFADMTRYRSQMIARTETADALGQSFLVRGQELEIDGKEWIRGSAYPCDICDPNANVGIIPFNQAFPSGHMTVSGHPNCTCACAPARLPK